MVGGAVSLALILASCGDNDEPVDPGAPEGVQHVDNEPEFETTYYSNGTRSLVIWNTNRIAGYVVEACDGRDLVDYSYSDLERSVDHPACLDGQLTPSDF